MRKIIIFLLIFCIIPQIYAASKHAVRGKNGMVVSSHEIASQVGVDILKKGGNAIDAAIAVGFALAVVFPTAGNLGGGGFMVIHFPDGNSTTIDYREKAPLKAHRSMYLDENGNLIDDLSLKGYLASGVPGSVAGLTMALEKYGSMKLKTVIDPAIKLAKRGFPVGYKFHKDLVRLQDIFKEFPASAKKFLKKNGEPYNEGEIFKQPDLKNTLKLIASKGADGFYKGRLAYLIAKDMADNGGNITKEDLAKYRAIERKPIKGTYRDYEIISMGPPSSGGIAIVEALNILENFELNEMGFNSSKYIHLLTEVLRYVYKDRSRFLGDSDFIDIPISGLLDKEYADKIAAKFDSLKATSSIELDPPSPQILEGNHTTHYAVIDKNHLTVSVTTTINSGYGSKAVIKDAGFLMNNEMDDFAAKPGSPNVYGLISEEVNAIAAEKRMLSSMSPTIILKNDKVVMTVGSMGGSRIITAVLQIILNVLDHDMTIQEAVDAPRIHHQWLPDYIRCERFVLSTDVKQKLESFGHIIKIQEHYSTEAHAIYIDSINKEYLGAADSRYYGKAVGY